MKKFIGIILAMAISFTLIPSTFAYSDVSNREDITVLSDLGIIDGFEDDTFRADEPLTRAQHVKIICSLLGYIDESQSATNYIDVPSTHWASGYINQATALKIVAGFGDGTFQPDVEVTYEQAIKTVVCALGYEPAAQTMASANWYNGYLNIASSLGITKGVKGSIGETITRGDMAKLVYNALSTQVMDVKTWGGNSTEYAKSDDTILSKYLEIEKWEGIVTNTPYMSFMAGANDGIIDLVDSYIYNYDGKKTENTFKTAKCDKDVEELLGKKVTCYVGEDSKGEWRIFSIAERDNYNDVIVIKASDVQEIDGDYVLYEGANGKTTKVKVSSEATYVCNYAEVADFDYSTANGYVTFINNDNESGYDYVIYFSYDVLGSVVKDIEAYDDIITFDADDIDEYDVEDEDVTIIVCRDGEPANITDIEVDDVISVIGTDDFKIYLVSSAKVTGKVKGLDKEEKIVTIDGEEYNYNGVNFTLSDYITAYINVDNEIVAIDTDDIAVNKYGMIIRAYTSSDDDAYKLEIIGTNGVKGTYEVAEKQAATVRALLESELGFSDGNGKLKYADIAKSIFSLTVKSSDGTITGVKKAATGDVTKIKNKKYDEETMTFGPIDINSSTVLFSIEQASDRTEVKADDVTVGEAVDFFTDDEGKDYTIYPIVPRDEVYAILIGTGITGTVNTKSDAVIIETVTIAHIESEDDIGYIITGIQGGKAVEYELFGCAKPNKGDVILLGAKNNNGVIEKYEPLTNAIDIKTTDSDLPNGKVREITGKVNRNDTDGTRLYFTNGTNVLLKSSANYTLVDCTSSKIKVEKKSKGVSIFGSAEKYESYAYVRYYDDVQTEVIIYRFNKVN